MQKDMSIEEAQKILTKEELKNWFYKTYLLNEIPHFSQIRIETTNLCGCNCFMCPHKKMTRKKGTMSFSTLENILKQLININYPIQFHMHGFGESLLCKDLPKRINLVIEKNSYFQPFIITTLAYDLDKDWFESLFKNGLKFISVSMYGYNEKTYSLIHGNKNFEFVVRNLQYLTEFAKKYNISATLQFDNFSIYPPGINSEVQLKEKQKFLEELMESTGYTKENFPLRIIGFSLHNYGNSEDWLPKRGGGGVFHLLWRKKKKYPSN